MFFLGTLANEKARADNFFCKLKFGLQDRITNVPRSTPNEGKCSHHTRVGIGAGAGFDRFDRSAKRGGMPRLMLLLNRWPAATSQPESKQEEVGG